MIYAMTPNPALDLEGEVDDLIPNEKAYVTHETRSPGGNSINAARIIKKLGAPVLVSGFSGGGVGAEIETLLDREKVSHQFIKIKGHTRINMTVVNCKTLRQTRLSFPGPQIASKERQEFFRFVSQLKSPALLLVGGSLPPGLTGADIARIIRNANRVGIATIADVPGPILKDVVAARPLMIKPNLIEFQGLTGKQCLAKEEVMKEAKKYTNRVPFVCVSSVEKGALLVTPSGSWFGTIPKITVKTSVGAGDSMVGAMSTLLWQKRLKAGLHCDGSQPMGDFPAELLRWGLASACATLALKGLHLGEAKHIRYYLPKIRIRRVE